METIVQFISFFLEEDLYGIDIRVVKEITPLKSLTRVPRTPPRIRGVVNIRGQVVLVNDLSVILGRERSAITDESRIIILKSVAEIRNKWTDLVPENMQGMGSKPVGFLVDRIGDVTQHRADMVEAVPAHLGSKNAGYFEGVIRLDADLLIVVKATEAFNF